MQIVVEYVLLDNLMIDASLLYLTAKTLKLSINKLGLFTASSFGAGFAVLSPLIPFGGFFAIVIKMLVAAVMAYMLEFSFKKFFLKTLLFIGYTFLFGGALIGIFSFLGISVYDGIALGYVSSLPLGAILVSLCVFCVFAFKVIKALFDNKFVAQNSCLLKIMVNNKTADIRGFVDTGNTLKNNQGRPVIVINEDTLKNWFDAHERLAIMLNKNTNITNLQDLVVSSLGGNYKIKVFDCLAIVSGIQKQVALGIAPNKIKCGDCIAIVGSEVLEV